MLILKFGNVGVFKKQRVVITASAHVMRGLLFHKVALGILQPPISEWHTVPRFFCICKSNEIVDSYNCFKINLL